MQSEKHTSRDSQTTCVSASDDGARACVSVFRNGETPDMERCAQLLRDYIRQHEPESVIPSASRP